MAEKTTAVPRRVDNRDYEPSDFLAGFKMGWEAARARYPDYKAIFREACRRGAI